MFQDKVAVKTVLYNIPPFGPVVSHLVVAELVFLGLGNSHAIGHTVLGVLKAMGLNR